MTTQIAVKLPDELVAAADCLVVNGTFASRSDLVRRGIEVVVSSARQEAIDAAYEDGYTRVPETAAELREAERLAQEALREEPWERWW
ncbi:MAG: ribbon-helix-helix domain-containing protein [Actinobacteria bacterium]|jgi:Arc/MetJ-type ribon-helix-helix transcriptional regulator|nr:ribbon-helix-helix domain-containing protein [Actinomycetota bacterium]